MKTVNSSFATNAGSYMNTRLKMIALPLFCLVLVACGGGKKAPETVAVDDITRPPQTISGQRQEVQERNPEETISFDEWRKQRLEEQRRQQQADETP